MKELSDFAKEVLASGRLLPVEEAFKMYPPEEEDWDIIWAFIAENQNDFREAIFKNNKVIDLIATNNKSQFIIEETNTQFFMGDVVLVDEFKYPNGMPGTRHLFVILDDDGLAVPIEYFAMIISSKLDKLKFETNVSLPKNNVNNLNKNSLVKTDYIYRLPQNKILSVKGKVELKQVVEYKRNYLKRLTSEISKS